MNNSFFVFGIVRDCTRQYVFITHHWCIQLIHDTFTKRGEGKKGRKEVGTLNWVKSNAVLFDSLSRFSHSGRYGRVLNYYFTLKTSRSLKLSSPSCIHVWTILLLSRFFYIYCYISVRNIQFYMNINPYTWTKYRNNITISLKIEINN